MELAHGKKNQNYSYMDESQIACNTRHQSFVCFTYISCVVGRRGLIHSSVLTAAEEEYSCRFRYVLINNDIQLVFFEAVKVKTHLFFLSFCMILFCGNFPLINSLQRRHGRLRFRYRGHETCYCTRTFSVLRSGPLPVKKLDQHGVGCQNSSPHSCSGIFHPKD